MYTLTDAYLNLVFTFADDGSILDLHNKKIGSVANGTVYDLDGTQARASIEGDKVLWHGVNPGPQLSLFGAVILQVDGGTPVAIVVGADNDGQRMIAALAYWEFAWSVT
jgi:hypothetical protein